MPAKAKKPKSDERVVMYVRVRTVEHAKIAKIADKRGYPHTIASVVAEMITRGLQTEAVPSGKARA